jgi:predicted ester cyclase
MTPEENNAVCVEFFETAWNTGVVREDLLTADALDHSTVGGKLKTERGAASFQGIVGMFHAGIPDIKLTVEDAIYAGDKVVHRWRLDGTNSGSLMGIPPTGKAMTVRGTTTVRMEDGKIAERWANVDELGMLQQLGVVPPPPGAH